MGGPAKKAMIRLHGVGLAYPGGKRALSNLDLEVMSGEYLGLIGKSGCGKSTLLNLIAGIAPFRLKGSFSGEGAVAGQMLPYGPELSSAFCAYVHQEPEDSFVEGRVIDEVAFGSRCKGYPDVIAFEKASSSLDLLGAGRLAGSMTDELSGGEKQLVAIASALSSGNRILLLDEPGSQLDPRGRMVLSKGLRELRRRDPGLTIVHVEQRHDQLLRCDRIAILHDGRIVATGDTVGVLMDREALHRNGLEMDPMLSLYSKMVHLGLVPAGIAPWKIVPTIVRSVRGLDLGTIHSGMFRGKDLPRLVLEEVSFRYPGGRTALRGIGIDLSGPGPLCLIGPNGSGKSTLGKLLCGLVHPDRGSVSGAENGFYLFQRPGTMMFNDTVEEELTCLARRVPSGVLERLGLSDLLESDPFSLSVGERQRLGIAMAWGSGAPFAVLDEPFKGLDHHSLKGVHDVLMMPGFPPFVIITNDMDPAYLCPRLVIMDRGSIRFIGGPDDPLRAKETYDLLRWPVPGNILIGRAAGIEGAPTYGEIERGLEGVRSG
jgi:energy-coupling factor transporter ATP-binding protein EcfA2